jgi:hypothetical protein
VLVAKYFGRKPESINVAEVTGGVNIMSDRFITDAEKDKAFIATTSPHFETLSQKRGGAPNKGKSKPKQTWRAGARFKPAPGTSTDSGKKKQGGGGAHGKSQPRTQPPPGYAATAAHSRKSKKHAAKRAKKGE